MEKDDNFKEMMATFVKNTQRLQEQIHQAYHQAIEENKDRIVMGKAGGDMVTAHVSLKMHLTALEWHPSLLQEKEEVIKELIMVAVNQALYEAQTVIKNQMLEITKKMELPPDIILPFKEED